MRELPAENVPPQGVDGSLLEHARMGLKRIHTVSQPGGSQPEKQITGIKENGDQKSTTKNSKKKKQKIESPAPNAKPEKKVTYISTKKPVEKSIFYQHSKQGMKYWFEEEKSKSYTSKVPIGRKGTLLGLVDAPYK